MREKGLILAIEDGKVYTVYTSTNYKIGDIFYAEDDDYYYIFRVIDLFGFNPSAISKYKSNLQHYAEDLEWFESYNISVLLFGPVLELIGTIDKFDYTWLNVKLYPRPCSYIYHISENPELAKFLAHENLFSLPSNILKKIFARNILVVGASGTGKSTLIKYLLPKIKKYARTKILVFDFHGEYELSNAEKIKPLIHEDEILPSALEDIFQLTPVQSEFLYFARKMFKENWISNIKRICYQKTYFTDLFMESTILTIRRRIEELLSSNILTTNKSESIINKVLNSDKNIIIIDLSDYEIFCSRIIIYSVLWFLFNKRYKFKCIIDEAHNILLNNDQETIIEKIFREGRKFDISCILITQTPSSFSPTIMNNTDTFIIFRLPNERERRIVMYSLPRDFSNLDLEVRSLESRIAILVSSFWPVPIYIEF